MVGARRLGHVTVALLIFGVLQAAAFAQWDGATAGSRTLERSSSSLERSSSGLERSSSGVIREYVATESVTGEMTLPSNLLFPSIYRATLEAMLRHSATFRRQCLRIAGEPGVTIHLQVPSFGTRGARAMTRFVRQKDGRLEANIEIAPMNDDVELVAHELEHVIEQIDRIDLPSKATLPDSGVHTLSGNMFETTRATRVGLKVAQEVRASVRRTD
jgi:hypothetical protein